MAKKYIISATIKAESRKALIKNLRANALYIEDHVTDEEFENITEDGKFSFDVETIRVLGAEEP